jgi:hypothetical protein
MNFLVAQEKSLKSVVFLSICKDLQVNEATKIDKKNHVRSKLMHFSSTWHSLASMQPEFIRQG